MIVTHVLILTLFVNCEAAKILAFFPISTHSEVFYPLIKELAKRGHEVYFITSKPLHPGDKTIETLKEVVLEDLSREIHKKFPSISTLHYEDMYENETRSILLQIFEEQMKNIQIQRLVDNHKTFDLLLLPNFRPAMIWSFIYKAPVIKLSQTVMRLGDSENVGAPTHPIYYPDISTKQISNLSLLEMLMEVYSMYNQKMVFDESEDQENEMIKRIFGPEVPFMSDLEKNTEMLFLNSNNFWERNRPLPKNVVYFGNIDQISTKKLPEDLKIFLDSSNGTIYVNVGNKVLSTETIQMFLETFSELPYNVLWRSGFEGVRNIPENVMIRKWFPESVIVWHPNVKLIITQGDHKITEEAIEAGIPLIGLLGAREQMIYEEYEIGIQLDWNRFEKEELRSTVVMVIEDPRYRENILRLRTMILDTKSPPLDNAILWIEYVLKHSAAHLKSPASNLSWFEYYEIELVLIIIISITILLCSFWLIFKMVMKKFEAILAYQARSDDV